MRQLDRSLHPKIWGAASLDPWFANAGEKIGEVWFTHSPPLPLLVKFIFTTDRLSVQVHPSKTEMWHVLRADPGANVAVGFREAITGGRARRAAESGEIVDLLEWLPVAPGDTIYVPSGTVHAIGAGVALCEVQQNSDVTYRFYDYGRPRDLHLEQALAVADFTRHPGKSIPRPGAEGESVLAECPYFSVTRMELPRGGHEMGVREGDTVVVIDGAGEFEGRPFSAGEVWLVPHGCQKLRLRADGAARLLRVRQR